MPSVAGERITSVSFGMLIQSPLMRQLHFFKITFFFSFPTLLAEKVITLKLNGNWILLD